MSTTELAPRGITAEFWEAAERGVLVRPVCQDCGRSFFTPQWACPFCRSERWSYEASTGRGVVYTHTTVHRGPDPSWPTPYVLAIVDVEEGWHLLTRVQGEDPDVLGPGALIGHHVEVCFERQGHSPSRALPTFVRVGGDRDRDMT